MYHCVIGYGGSSIPDAPACLTILYSFVKGTTNMTFKTNFLNMVKVRKTLKRQKS